MQEIKELLKKVVLNDMTRSVIAYIEGVRSLRKWEKDGRPIPPPHIVKQNTIKEYAKKRYINTLIESGTYLGVMVYAMKDVFDRIISIEVDNTLYLQARKRFADYRHISIIHGDSGEELRKVLSNVEEPCLFWLDGHYSAGITSKGELNTPILYELDSIFNHAIKNHVILIDDARCFTGQDDYPLIKDLEKFISEKSDYKIKIENDIIMLENPTCSPKKRNERG